MFSKAWTPLTPLLSSGEKMVTSGSLNSLFEGKSVNSAGFLLAVLIHEGLIQIVGEKPRTYERRDPKEFMDALQVLMDTENQPPKKKEKKQVPEDRES